ncbi:biotin--[acetyl-CoA-carboxylase] ligase [Salimicrobium flavidum]|uniref:Bifunctional ligase/repressor BirA n=1 Tax=Salimicrobium flavidum TaxID=570947 RepID=A0A1N7IJE9_9BACI|nr:biotin--[acetyl-CoA-carboxylase] ligase [Salimicrobium flavidum]SIS37197.1 BirA family transcriptional regulator, biotin operon repressor / biotin-[acetyl-CoA-carboxylase] ligase [Salimicrobium flavidum]
MGERTGSTKRKLIDLFKETEDYLSGQWLADTLSVSRTAVWKNIKELEKEGFLFEVVKKKGYKLVGTSPGISPASIQSTLNTKEIGRTFYHFTEVKSTQEKIHTMAKEGYPNGTVALADEQTAGKGRMKRDWNSLKGKGIWMSLLLRPSIPPQKAPQLTLVAATSIVNVLQASGIEATVKWPNDLMIGDRKVCGILTEMRAEQDSIDYLALGIGLNVNQSLEDMPVELERKATSLYMETGEERVISEIVTELLNRLEYELNRYFELGFSPFQEEWGKIGYKVGQWVSVSTWGEPWRAKIDRMEADGALMVLDSSGREHQLYSAEILWNENY